MTGASPQFFKIAKVREWAELTIDDGSVLVGEMFVEATSRIQNVVNDESPFFAFFDQDDQLSLLNKSAVIRVRPYDK
jgi:hypothetical protein